VTPFAAVDVAGLAAWISAIDFGDWPQQHRLAEGAIRPAMVTDLRWHDFGARTDAIVARLASQFVAAEPNNRMLSVVMPGHRIEPHRDAQTPGWVTRVHVPIATNARAAFIVGGERHHLAFGRAYLVNTEALHEVVNDGQTPRVHLMFDVRSRT
jgi:hypothetical protein